VAPGELNGAELEHRLIAHLLNEAEDLIRPLTGVRRDLLTHWLRRFEISNLKAIIRGKLARQTNAYIREQLLDLGPASRLPTEELLGTEDAAELLRRLEPTPYGDIARQARAIYEEHQDLFAVEAAIDRSYFAALDKRLNNLTPEDRRDMRPLFGAIIDQINLVWLLRYRFVYGLAPPHAYFLLSPGGYRAGSRELLELVKLGGLQDALRRIAALIGEATSEAPTLRQMEARLEALATRTAHYVLTHTTFNLARAVAYLWLREKQLLRIHAALKGQMLKLSSATIRLAVHGPMVET
jgi:V/A-type H+-transporting ATPase subunit C